MSFKSLQLRLSPQQQVEHDARLDQADIFVLDLARLLYAAAFPDHPRLGGFDPIPPLYLKQATTLRHSAQLRSDTASAIEKLEG